MDAKLQLLAQEALTRHPRPGDFNEFLRIVAQSGIERGYLPAGLPATKLADVFSNRQKNELLGYYTSTLPSVKHIPDVHDSAFQAVVSDSGLTAQRSRPVAAGETGIEIGEGAHGENLIAYDTAFERVMGSTAFVLNQLELSYEQTREQAQGWFRFSLIAAGVGSALIGIGIIVLIFGQTTAGLITTISGIVPNAAAALFFVQSKTANERVDDIQKRLSAAREIQTAVEIANTIIDAEERDRQKVRIVQQALQLEGKSSSNSV
jgi:hypothetical protein